LRSSQLPEPYRRRPGRSARSSPAKLGLVKVDPDYKVEYPGADASSTEAFATLVRAGTAALMELDRRIVATFDVPHPAATMLAVLDGAGEPLTPSQISERVLVASASTTATLDLLERRGWVRRMPNPDDRRSTLVEITPAGSAITDRLLPGIRAVERSAMDALTKSERVQFLALLGKVLGRLAELADEEPTPLDGERNRPARLGPPSA
jgi:DNA-binding MarR family transcriptional regulator